jgi:broad specificity phosphatase PhoE
VSSSPAGRARQTAALIAGGESAVEVVAELRTLDGDIAWSERTRAWHAGDDPRPAGGESLADGHARVVALLDGLRAKLRPGERAVWVTHGDIASLALGELRGTPLLERPTRDTLDTGAHACLPLVTR